MNCKGALCSLVAENYEVVGKKLPVRSMGLREDASTKNFRHHSGYRWIERQDLLLKCGTRICLNEAPWINNPLPIQGSCNCTKKAAKIFPQQQGGGTTRRLCVREQYAAAVAAAIDNLFVYKLKVYMQTIPTQAINQT